MPGYRGHLFGGAIAYACALSLVALYSTATLLTIFEWFLFSLAGALFPDVDIKSKGQKLFYLVISCLIIFCILKRKFELLGMVSALAMLPLLVNHRGLFHKIWFVIVFPAGIAWMVVHHFPAYTREIFFDTVFFVTGALSHLWLDFGFSRMLRRW